MKPIVFLLLYQYWSSPGIVLDFSWMPEDLVYYLTLKRFQKPPSKFTSPGKNSVRGTIIFIYQYFPLVINLTLPDVQICFICSKETNEGHKAYHLARL